mgnify:CR=1 FL=1
MKNKKATKKVVKAKKVIKKSVKKVEKKVAKKSPSSKGGGKVNKASEFDTKANKLIVEQFGESEKIEWNSEKYKNKLENSQF